jgi:hypothetical protein
MKQITKYIGMVAILSIFALATVSGQIGVASAEKAEGSTGAQSPKSYGSATDDIVCGASLCSTPEGSPEPVNVGKAS